MQPEESLRKNLWISYSKSLHILRIMFWPRPVVLIYALFCKNAILRGRITPNDYTFLRLHDRKIFQHFSNKDVWCLTDDVVPHRWSGVVMRSLGFITRVICSSNILEDTMLTLAQNWGDISITLLRRPKCCQNCEGRNCGQCELCQLAQPRPMFLIFLQFNLLKPPLSSSSHFCRSSNQSPIIHSL